MASSWQSCPRESGAPRRARSSSARRCAGSETRGTGQWGWVRSAAATRAATAGPRSQTIAAAKGSTWCACCAPMRSGAFWGRRILPPARRPSSRRRPRQNLMDERACVCRCDYNICSIKMSASPQPARRRRPRQLALEFRTWGGKRAGAGRKPRGARAGVVHRARDEWTRPMPLHVTLRMAPHVYNLRSRRSFRVIAAALRLGGDRFDVRVVEFSVQGNHIHLVVEAPNRRALARAVQGLSIRGRVARRLGLAGPPQIRACRTPAPGSSENRFARSRTGGRCAVLAAETAPGSAASSSTTGVAATGARAPSARSA